MANTNMGYYKGEDHQGRTMYAYQRGPADPDIVGKIFGMKNVKTITKDEYDAGMAPEKPQKAAAKAEGPKDLNKLVAKELIAYGAKLGLTFPAVGMKKADMIKAIVAQQNADPPAPETRQPEEMNEYGDELTDPPAEADAEDEGK